MRPWRVARHAPCHLGAARRRRDRTQRHLEAVAQPIARVHHHPIALGERARSAVAKHQRAGSDACVEEELQFHAVHYLRDNDVPEHVAEEIAGAVIERCKRRFPRDAWPRDLPPGRAWPVPRSSPVDLRGRRGPGAQRLLLRPRSAWWEGLKLPRGERGQRKWP